MYSWGSSANGELGLGGSEIEQVSVPTFCDFSQTWDIKQIKSGLTHSLILTNSGQVYSCGNNEVGQLGHNKIERRPQHVDGLENHNIVQVAVGDQHSLALTAWGMLYAWGENGFGQLGINSIESHVNVPKLVKNLARKQVIQVAAGSNHSIALTADGEVYCWGHNHAGQLGLGHCNGPQNEPVLVKSLIGCPIIQVVAGGMHTAVLTHGGFLLTWGSNKYGQLGYTPKNDAIFCANPTSVPNLATYSETVKYVAAGEGHTAILDSCGKLWTFGHGRYGQLGHSSFGDGSVPRTVLDLCGSKVTQLACGRGHTVVFIPSRGQIYSFGQGMSGQLGTKNYNNCNSPQVVLGPWQSHAAAKVYDPNCKIYVKEVFAGGDTTFATVMKEFGDSEDYCSKMPQKVPLLINEEIINQMSALGEDDAVEDDLFTLIETAFNSSACWNMAFQNSKTNKHSHNLDFRAAESAIAKLGRLQKKSLEDMVLSGLEEVVKQLPKKALSIDTLRCFILLPLFKNFMDAKHMYNLHLPYAETLLGLEGGMQATFRQWFHTLPRDFLSRLLAINKVIVIQMLVDSGIAGTDTDRRVLISALKVLELLYKENLKYGKKSMRLPYEDFYIPEIGEKIDIRTDYINWLASKGSAYTRTNKIKISFCEFPFLFDAHAKTLLLRADATRQMQGAMQEAVLNSNPMQFLFNPNQAAHIQFLNLSIHRNNIVQDTINQLLFHGITDFKRPLRVSFIGEEAEDAGGVRKEFFLLLMREILNPDYGMFTEFSETRAIWFREGAIETDATYALIGIVCGLAIYNFTIVHLPFPLALYKKLLGVPARIDDLTDLDPTLTKNLYSLLEYDGDDVEDVFCLNFSVTQDFFGESLTIPLKDGGENIPVTSENKQEYVDLLVDYKLNKSVESQYKAFHTGFYKVCGDSVLKLFQPFELMALVVGNENYDWNELEKNAEYKGEFASDHQTIKLFWEVFHELALEQKKEFLKFLTGTDRIPILGMKALKMIIQSTNDTNFLPVAHTCVTQLDLPTYNTKEKMRYKLVQAIQQSEGFGLV